MNYLGFQAWFIYPAWFSQHAPSYFWTVIIVISGLLYLPKKSKNIVHSVIEKLVQASWHIFLVQMAFFWAVGSVVKSLFLGELVITANMDVSTLIQMSMGGFLLTCINLVICITLGYLFYLIKSKKFIADISLKIRKRIDIMRGR